MTRPTARAAALALLGLVLGLSACARRDAEVERAVREYDDALVHAYRTGDASGMSRVAGADEARRVGVLVGMKAEDRVVLEAALEAFEVVRVEVASADAAALEARERWRWVDRPLAPGAAAGAPVVSTMTMRYELAREDGRWKVREVRTLASDRAPGAAPPRAP